MNWKISSAFQIFVCGCCLFSTGLVAVAQSGAPPAAVPAGKAVVYTTLPKLAIAKLRVGDAVRHEVRGRATFTLTAANDNDTVAGTLVYAIPAESRQALAQATGKALNSIPASVTQKNVVASFQKGTACPVVQLETRALELEVAGAKLQFNRIVLEVTETADEVPQHFCAWARQINVNRQRRGVIASLNRLLAGEQ